MKKKEKGEGESRYEYPELLKHSALVGVGCIAIAALIVGLNTAETVADVYGHIGYQYATSGETVLAVQMMNLAGGLNRGADLMRDALLPISIGTSLVLLDFARRYRQ